MATVPGKCGGGGWGEPLKEEYLRRVTSELVIKSASFSLMSEQRILGQGVNCIAQKRERKRKRAVFCPLQKKKFVFRSIRIY